MEDMRFFYVLPKEWRRFASHVFREFIYFFKNLLTNQNFLL